MRARRWLLGLSLAAALGGLHVGTARADFVLTGTQHLDVTTSHTLGALHDASTADVLAGGFISDAVVSGEAILRVQRPSGVAVSAARAYGSGQIAVMSGEVTSVYTYSESRVDISGGSLFSVRAEDTSSVDISGGAIGSRLDAYESSRVTVTGGSVNWLVGHDACRFIVSGGNVTNLGTPFLANSVTVTVTGGSIENLTADGPSTADIRGGTIDSLAARKTSVVTLHGRDFAASGGLSLVEFDVIGGLAQYEVVGTGVLTGKWFDDDTPWTIPITQNETTATILAIPEPATLGLLALGGLAVLRKRRA